jgi:hypothetical protein
MAGAVDDEAGQANPFTGAGQDMLLFLRARRQPGAAGSKPICT